MESYVELDSATPDDDSSNKASALTTSPPRLISGQQPNRIHSAAARTELDDYRKLIDELRRHKLLPDTVLLAQSVELWNLAFKFSREK